MRDLLAGVVEDPADGVNEVADEGKGVDEAEVFTSSDWASTSRSIDEVELASCPETNLWQNAR